MSKPTVPIIYGPTASGKTALALEWSRSKRFDRPIEIISMDSALVYRYMDIGTAKPSNEELAEVPHHLINILDPEQSYSTAQFVSDCHRAIRDTISRNHQPVIVGGTLLYLHSLLNGIDELPGADAAIRAKLDQQAKCIGWPAMYQRLQAIDPEFASGIAPQDAQRIQRALEVHEISGKPLSSFFSKATPQERLDASFFNWQLHPLLPADRAVLHKSIAMRFEKMLQQGLIDEVKHLRKRPLLHPALPSMRCVGYRQTWQFLDTEQGAKDWQHLRDTAIAATRQLAKRQITWMRKLG